MFVITLYPQKGGYTLFATCRGYKQPGVKMKPQNKTVGKTSNEKIEILFSMSFYYETWITLVYKGVNSYFLKNIKQQCSS